MADEEPHYSSVYDEDGFPEGQVPFEGESHGFYEPAAHWRHRADADLRVAHLRAPEAHWHHDAGYTVQLDATQFPSAEDLRDASIAHEYDPHSAGAILEQMFLQDHGEVPVNYIEEFSEALRYGFGSGWGFDEGQAEGHVACSVLKASAIADRHRRRVELTQLAVRPCVSALSLVNAVVYQLAVTCVQHHCTLVLHPSNPAIDSCIALLSGGRDLAGQTGKEFDPAVLHDARHALRLEAFIDERVNRMERLWYMLPTDPAAWDRLIKALVHWWLKLGKRHGYHVWFDHFATLIEGLQSMRPVLKPESWGAFTLQEAAGRVLAALGDRATVVVFRWTDPRAREFALDSVRYILLQKGDYASPDPNVVDVDEDRRSLNPAYMVLSRKQRAALGADKPAFSMPASAEEWAPFLGIDKRIAFPSHIDVRRHDAPLPASFDYDPLSEADGFTTLSRP